MMTYSEANEQLAPILPKVKENSDVSVTDRAGKWYSKPARAFQDVASSLDYKSPGELKSISSVPTMWARPLSMEMALHNPFYPIREQAIDQWQGMLAAIALAEINSFPLKVRLPDLNTLRHNDPFARSLWELLPDPVNALYSLNGKNPWQDCYVFFWEGKPVGMSSPSTIVVPSEDGIWTGLDWWDRPRMRLESPQKYLNTTQKDLLWRWLDNLRNELNNYGGQPKAINAIAGLLEDFRDSLGDVPPKQKLSLSSNPQFFGLEINRGVLTAINWPVKAEPQPSSVQLVLSPQKQDQQPQPKPLLIIDQAIAEAWGYPPQDVWVHDGKTLASVSIEDLRDGTLIWRDVKWCTSDDLFLPEFSFIDIEEALPGALLPLGTKINFARQSITPLLPLNPILLDYLTPEDLIERVRLTPLNSSEGTLVRVELDLPLSGLNSSKSENAPPSNYRVTKEYLVAENNGLRRLPILEVWPHFQVKDWQEYYGFYYDGDAGDQTFQVSFPAAQSPHVFQEGRGNYQITRLSHFPSHIECIDPRGRSLGLIVLQTPEIIKPRDSWTVGVDFGTSFTNIYVNQNSKVDPLPLDNLHLRVTQADPETRGPVLFEYFIPDQFIPVSKPLPLSTILTTRGRDPSKNQNDKFRPIYDGRIYVPENTLFNPQSVWMETDLKWELKKVGSSRLFLKHLALHITAQAAKQGINQIIWSLSFPSAFSRKDKNQYAKTWQLLTEELQTQTGVAQVCPQPDSKTHFQTESLATAQYFAVKQGLSLIQTTCIDMGGGTSDISIWQNNTLIHQCSVRLAGQHLFSEIVEQRPDFIIRIFELDRDDAVGQHWKDLQGTQFSSKLDVHLRLYSEEWLKNQKIFLEDNPQFEGLIRLMALGMAGLYYYIGTVLGVLDYEGKLEKEDITSVYMGGNGSRLLNWLDEAGQFDRHSEINSLFSRMLSRASGFKDSEEITELSKNPKDEVACGLVLAGKNLKGVDNPVQDLLIAGESCEVNDQLIDWKDRLEFEGKIDYFNIPDLPQLRKFLNEFHLAIKDLRLEGVTPFPNYTLAEDPEHPEDDDNPRLWREVEKKKKDILLDKIAEEGTDADNIRVEPPFILGLKALLKVLSKEWSQM